MSGTIIFLSLVVEIQKKKMNVEYVISDNKISHCLQ